MIRFFIIVVIIILGIFLVISLILRAVRNFFGGLTNIQPKQNSEINRDEVLYKDTDVTIFKGDAGKSSGDTNSE
jgi:hypothetical protein